jgi:tRNA dimethylallyltransferase
MASKPLLLVVAGPTAVGKTALAIRLAQHFGTSILSFDSRQCYHELGVAVAKPSAGELALVPHYFINSHSIQQPVEAAGFVSYALPVLEQLFSRHPVVVAVGGTGLYLRALLYGLDEMPAIPPDLRHCLRQQYEEKGLSWLYQQVQQEDPLYAADGEMQNPHRMLRALEIMRATGQSIRQFQRGRAAERPFRWLCFGITLPRPVLHQRIARRIMHMQAAGMQQEARALYPLRHLQALQTVGYQEWFDHFDGKISESEVLEQIAAHTRQYAKRQMTWFKKQQDLHWAGPEDDAMILKLAEAILTSA